MLFNVVRLPVLSIVAIVVAPYLKTKTPPISEMVKLVVATLAACRDVSRTAVGNRQSTAQCDVRGCATRRGQRRRSCNTCNDPVPEPAPIAVRNAVASNADTVLSALNCGNVTALGFVMVNRFAPSVVAPRLVRAPEADDAPVPPSVIAKSVP
jgi:hypothetical protein